ncbi:DNA ligase 1 [Sarcoptes scabiei]|nr:DNA ligase 1 [Sarcoptes scabiei]
MDKSSNQSGQNSSTSLKIQTSMIVDGQQNVVLSSKKQPPPLSLPERIPAFGFLMAFLSVICFSLSSLIVRIVVTLPSIQILICRCLCQFVVYFFASILIYRQEFFGHTNHRIDLLCRVIFGTISQSTIYVAYRLIPLSDASSIHFASPVFVTVFAYFVLKEPLTRLQIMTGTFTMIGVFIITKPEFLFGTESNAVHEQRLEGTILSVIASMSAASAMISLRKLKTTPASVVVMWYSFSLILCCSIYLSFTRQWTMPDTVETWLWMLAIGLCGILNQYFITLAFQYEKAGPISLILTLNIALSFLWEISVLNETVELTSIIGASLICSCVTVLALVRWYKDSPECFHRIQRKICCFCSKPWPQQHRSSKSNIGNSDSKNVKNENRQKNKKTTSKNDAKRADSWRGAKKDLKNHTIVLDFDDDDDLDCNQSDQHRNHHRSMESIDSIIVQNTVSSNAILLRRSDDDDDGGDGDDGLVHKM